MHLPIRQLLYFSLTSRDLSEQDLLDLLKASRARNIDHEVTGLLIYVGHYFVQHIEGAPAKIEQLASNIKADDRISDFTVLLDVESENRVFPNWLMGFNSLVDLDVQIKDGFINLKSSKDLDTLEVTNDAALSMMRRFYEGNRHAPDR